MGMVWAWAWGEGGMGEAGDSGGREEERMDGWAPALPSFWLAWLGFALGWPGLGRRPPEQGPGTGSGSPERELG